MKVNIVIPTRNEEDNIKILIPKLKGYGHEVVIVDDSDDKTAEVAKSLGATVIHGRHKGLAQAVLDGIDATQSDAFIVMDADLQHDETIIPEICRQLEFHDLVVMTKHIKEAQADFSWWRKVQSNLGTWSAHIMIPAPVSDPMTGYFAMRRKCLDGIPRGEFVKLNEDRMKTEQETIASEMPKDFTEEQKVDWYLHKGYASKQIGLEAIGFKIGLELFAKAKWVSHAEIPIHFKNREFGMSKGTRNSLQKHLWRLFKNSFEYTVELPKGSEEYFAFYEGNDWQKDWKQSIAAVLQQITMDIQPDKLLDIGAGSSPNINYMVAKDKYGIDINEDAMKFMPYYSDRVSFKQGSVLEIPFADKEFDVATCIEVLEHLYPQEVEQGVSEIARVVKDNGYVILATPNYNSVLWNVIEGMQKLVEKGAWTSDHHTKFNRKKLRELCEKHGLKEIRYDSIMSNMDMVATFQKVK